MPLKGPSDGQTRATGDKVRGAVFNVLAAQIPGARMLDLYAGTGALGVEALSRGAASCLFVERFPAACRVVEANLRSTRLASNAYVWCAGVRRVLDALERRAARAAVAPASAIPVSGRDAEADEHAATHILEGKQDNSDFNGPGSTFWPPYDVIMLDPPYDDPEIGDVVRRIGRAALLGRGGYLVLEHSKRAAPPSGADGLMFCRTRLYGDTAVTIWQA